MKFALGIALMLGAAVFAAADDRIYEVRKYTAAPDQFEALLERMKSQAVPFLAKHNITLHAVLTPLKNDQGEIVLVVSHDSAEARRRNWAAFTADEAWKQVIADTDKNGALTKQVEVLVVKTTDFSPVLTALKPADVERIFELRTYTATPGNLDRLLARFRNHTLKLFEKHGMTNVIYWTAAEGEKNAETLLVYLLAHDTDAARVKSFDAFRQDTDWVNARAASEAEAGGSLTEAKDGVLSVVLVPTDFSPLK